MKVTLLLYVLIITLAFSCSNNVRNDKTVVSESPSTEKGINKNLNDGAKEVTSELEVDAKESMEEKKEVKAIIMDVFDPDYINGRWEAEDQNGYSFGAWFDTDEGKVIGQYCAMNHDASRVDCGTHEEIESCYLKSGPVKGKKILEIEVVSCYALKKGKAELSVQDDGNLVWRLVEPPGEFEVDHFAPEVALLRKVSFDPYE